MSDKKVFKVELHKEEGCYYSDIVWIPFNPTDIESLEVLFKDMAVEEKDYTEQGWYREMKELFYDARIEWRKQRNESKKRGHGK